MVNDMILRLCVSNTVYLDPGVTYRLSGIKSRIFMYSKIKKNCGWYIVYPTGRVILNDFSIPKVSKANAYTNFTLKHILALLHPPIVAR